MKQFFILLGLFGLGFLLAAAGISDAGDAAFTEIFNRCIIGISLVGIGFWGTRLADHLKRRRRLNRRITRAHARVSAEQAALHSA